MARSAMVFEALDQVFTRMIRRCFRITTDSAHALTMSPVRLNRTGYCHLVSEYAERQRIDRIRFDT